MRIRFEICLLTFLAVNTSIKANAQALVEDPAPAKNQAMLRVSMPKVSPKSGEITSLPKPVFREPWWKLDKDVTALGIIHGAASLMDGITTRTNITHGSTEVDPLDRLFLGAKPTWSRMLPLGSLEVYGTALLAQHMKHSKCKVMRKLYLVPQIGFIVHHTYEGGNNVKSRNTFLTQGY
jgi:hypothetical protein